MAEALAAIGLAGNIVQFVDFGMRLVSQGQELYHSIDGALAENVELEEITADLKVLSQSLAKGTTRAPGTLASSDENSPRKLAGTCVQLANELLAHMKSLKVDSSKNRTWESIKKSLRSFQKKGKTKDIEKRLRKVKEQILFHLVFLLNNRQSLLLPTVDGLVDTTTTVGTETMCKLDMLRSELQDFIQKESWSSNNKSDFSKLSEMLMNLVGEGQRANKVHGILESLHFKQIRVRQSNVKEAHRETFEWIFKKPENSNLVEWLRTENGVYWIAGKAGSGKSTLMKFLCNHPRSSLLLEEWSGQWKIIVVSHFFWSAGTSIQKSQEGLLRTLLFQVLVQCTELLPVICPDRWNDNIKIFDAWSCSELFRAFETLASLNQLPMRFCFFIDGLDEYDGEHVDIIRTIQTLATSPSIKFCVSSRPWTVFVDAFDGCEWKLFLQDLTHNDIRLYVKDNLEEDPRFKELTSRDTASNFLAQQIVNKAQGVFLWVFLVVCSLLRGLTSKDDVSDLKRRLEELPADLETYFKHMLDTIENVYLQQTAQIFLLTVHASTALSVLDFHFLDCEKEDPNYSLQQQIRPLSEAEIVAIVEKKRRQLNARCKDLLEINEDPREATAFFRYSVGFLHRTVLDFLKTKDMQNLLSDRAGTDFEPNLSLRKSHLAQIKAVEIAHRSEPKVWEIVRNIIHLSREAEIHSDAAEIELLDEMDRTLSSHYNDTNLHWTHRVEQQDRSLGMPKSLHSMKSTDINTIMPTDSNSTFLELAVRCSLRHYAAHKLSECPEKLQNTDGLSLLDYALNQRNPLTKDSGDLQMDKKNEIDLGMLRFLLSRGADPNQIIDFAQKQTVWSTFLLRCYELAAVEARPRGGIRAPENSRVDLTTTQIEYVSSRGLPLRVGSETLSNWFEACKMLILHGGDANTKPHNATEVFAAIFTEPQSQQLESLFPAQQSPNEYTTLIFEKPSPPLFFGGWRFFRWPWKGQYS